MTAVDLISGHFRSIRKYFFLGNFDKMAAVGHFGCQKFTSDRISGHFRSIRNFYFFRILLTKWLPSALLDVRNSLSIAFLAILDQYWIFIFLEFFYKMAAGAHFGYPKLTFDRISGHFRSIRNFIFFEISHKMAAVGHFGCPKFTFDRISGHFRSILNFFFFGNFWQNGCRRSFCRF